MIRKLIKQGNGSYTVTLPAKWVRANNITDTIFLDVDETTIALSPVESMAKTRTIAVNDFSDISLRQQINELYRDGYSEITLTQISGVQRKVVKKLLEQFYIELEIVDETADTATLAMVSQPNGNHFVSLFKKLFQIVSQSLVSLEEKDFANVILLTEQYRKYDNFCRRYTQTTPTKHSLAYQSIFVHLLLIQTSLNRCAKHEILMETTDVHELFFSMSQAFFSKKSSAVQQIGQKFLELLEKTYTLKKIRKQDLVMAEFVRLSYSLSYPLVGVNLDAN